jgi:hypothetical protein
VVAAGGGGGGGGGVGRASTPGLEVRGDVKHTYKAMKAQPEH